MFNILGLGWLDDPGRFESKKWKGHQLPLVILLHRNSSNSSSSNNFTVTTSGSGGHYTGASTDLYQEVTCLHFLHIHPQYSQNLSQGVMKELNGLLLKYNPDIKGVPLLYSRGGIDTGSYYQPIPSPSGYPTPFSTSSVPVTSAAIIAENPLLHIWIRVRWLAFCPSPGSRVVGSVVKQGPEQVNFLLLGLFNATIKRSQLAGTLEWSESDAAWISPAHGRRIGLGDLLEFEVWPLKRNLECWELSGPLIKCSNQLKPKEDKLKLRNKAQNIIIDNKHGCINWLYWLYTRYYVQTCKFAYNNIYYHLNISHAVSLYNLFTFI